MMDSRNFANSSSSAFLTAAHPKMTEGADILCAASIDQIYAQKFGQDTPLPSIQLCIESVDGWALAITATPAFTRIPSAGPRPPVLCR
jgi:hypothetical protein